MVSRLISSVAVLSFTCIAAGGPPKVGADLALWLRADAGVSTTVNGAAVTQWTDQSAGIVLTATTGSVRYIADGGNCSMPSVRFSGARMTGSLGPGLTNATVFVAAHYNTPTSGNNYVYAFGVDGSNGSQMTFSRRFGTTSYHFNGATELLGQPVPGLVYHVFSQVFRSVPAGPPFHTAYMDGVNLAIANAPSGYNTSGAVSLGNWSSGGFGITGDIAEVLVYRAALNDRDRQAVEAYLNERINGVPGPAELVLRLRADSGTSTTTDGAAVTSWTDISGGMVMLTVPVGSSAPVFIAESLSCSQPAVRFSDDRMQATLPGGFTGATVFSVVRYGALTSTNEYVYTIGSVPSSAGQMSMSRFNPTTAYHFNGDTQFFGDPIPGGQYAVISQVFECSVGSGGFHRMFRNGQDLHVAAANVPYLANGELFLGNYSSGPNGLIGDLHELRIYRGAMSDADREEIEQELLALVPPLDPDLNDNGVVNGVDLGILLNSWSVPAGADGCGGTIFPCPADINGDCTVNGIDLGILLANWTL